MYLYAPPPTLKTVLIPTDLSPETRDLISWALREADAPDARLVMLHVVDIDSHVWAALSRSYTVGDLQKTLTELALESLQDIQAPHTDDTPLHIEAVVRCGRPADCILQVAQEVRADCIMMGRHHPTRLSEHLLGGTADKVLRQAVCPVMVVPMGPRE